MTNRRPWRPARTRRASDGNVVPGHVRRRQVDKEARARLLFDADFYVERYPDAARSRLDPWCHFRDVGQGEGRLTHPALVPIESALRMRAVRSETPLEDIARLFPGDRARILLRSWGWKRLRSMVHPDLYAAQSGGDVLDVSETLVHFLGRGVFEGLRVSALFHPAWYEQQVMAQLGDHVQGHPFFHWLTIGWKNRISPTPLFDELYYREAHPDLAKSADWLFDHYARHGSYERMRRPSAFFGPAPAAVPDAKQLQRPVVLARILEGSDPRRLQTGSEFETSVMRMAEKLKRLDTPHMRELVDKAYEIEPLVRRPYGPRQFTWPPSQGGSSWLMRRGEQVRTEIGIRQADTLVLVPHCRMAGSARVAGTLTKALRDVAGDESVVVLTTDLPDFERPDWFAPTVAVRDLSSAATGLPPAQRTSLLLDVVRGLQPRRVINVNSRMGWDLTRAYGRQLTGWTELSAYLFTWDLDVRGNKGGYPIQEFQDCLPHLRHVFIDSEPLREELIWRFALPPTIAGRLHLLHTPADFPEFIDHSENFARRRRGGRRLRAFWSGRFDRQKRFDLVVDLARMMPELEIWAWGKQILGELDVDFDDLPPNIRLRGTYHDFEELPVGSCDFFLYTAEWDGLPTILIDAGARGIATVASGVGGVGDVVNQKTGYRVADALNAAAYRAEIEGMLADPDEVTRRAKAMRAHVRELCSHERYRTDLAHALYGHCIAGDISDGMPTRPDGNMP